MWDVVGRREITSYRHHEQPVTGLRWHPEKELLASVADERNFVVTSLGREVDNGKRTIALDVRADSLTWHPTRPLLAAREGGRRLVVWNIADENDEPAWTSPPAEPRRTIRWSPDGGTLVSADRQGTLEWRAADDGEVQFTVEGNGRPVAGLVWNRNGERLLVLDAVVGANFTGKSARQLDVRTEHEARVLDEVEFGKGGRHQAVAIPGTSLVAVAQQSRATVRTLDGKVVHRLQGNSGNRMRVRQVVPSPDGSRVATASSDGTAIVWDVESGRRLCTLRGHTSSVSSVDWAPGGTRLVTGGLDGTVRVWDAKTGEEVLKLGAPDSSISSVAWSSDGTTIAASDYAQRLHLWTAKNIEQPSDKAFFLAARGRWAEAAAEYDRLIEEQDNSVGPFEMGKRGLCQLMDGDIEGYRRGCRQAIRWAAVQPDNVSIEAAVYICGLAPNGLDKYDRAIALARSRLDAGPHMHRRLGSLLLRAGRVDEALAELEMGDSSAETYYLRAIAHHAKGDAVRHRESIREGDEWTEAFNERRPELRFWIPRIILELLGREAHALGDPKQDTARAEAP